VEDLYPVNHKKKMRRSSRNLKPAQEAFKQVCSQWKHRAKIRHDDRPTDHHSGNSFLLVVGSRYDRERFLQILVESSEYPEYCHCPELGDTYTYEPMPIVHIDYEPAYKDLTVLHKAVDEVVAHAFGLELAGGGLEKILRTIDEPFILCVRLEGGIDPEELYSMLMELGNTYDALKKMNLVFVSDNPQILKTMPQHPSRRFVKYIQM
jgi:hypothetical protein